MWKRCACYCQDIACDRQLLPATTKAGLFIVLLPEAYLTDTGIAAEAATEERTRGPPQDRAVQAPQDRAVLAVLAV